MILKQVVVCRDDDRILFIQKDYNGKIIGLNFAQGADDFDNFSSYEKNDQDLLELYNDSKMFVKGDNELEIINNVIWLMNSIELI